MCIEHNSIFICIFTYIVDIYSDGMIIIGWLEKIYKIIYNVKKK